MQTTNAWKYSGRIIIENKRMMETQMATLESTPKDTNMGIMYIDEKHKNYFFVGYFYTYNYPLKNWC